MRGRVYGVAAGSLSDVEAVFGNADTNRIGAAGEQKTALELGKLAALENGPTVLHDLRIPGANANIDHIVVYGRTVMIVDSKVWRNGFYFTLGEKTYRTGDPGKLFSRFESADKRTIPFAVRRVEEYLTGLGLRPVMKPGTLVLWPSSQAADARKLRTFFYKPAGGVAVSVGASVNNRAAWWRRPADPLIVASLTRLLISAGA